MSRLLRKLRLRVVIRRYEVIIFGCLLLLSGAVIPAKWEPPFHPSPAPVLPAPAQSLQIALTFDDGPHTGRTEKLLQILKDGGVPATFFVVGKMADRYPQLVREIAEQGHEVANHTYTHPNLAHLSNAEVLTELDQTREVIRRLTGQPAVLYRPPGGEFNRRIARAASKAGYRMVLWSVISHDVDGISPGMMRRRILGAAGDGGIILMHSGMQNTIVMLPDLIADLKSRGYQFVTMSTLLKTHTPKRPLPSDTPVLQTASQKQY